jgi:site-specific recombinase XerD
MAAFADYMRRDRGFSAGSIHMRVWSVRRFLDRLGISTDSVREVTITRIDETFQEMVKQCGWARRTVQTQAEHLRGFFRYAEMHGWPTGLAPAIQSPRVFSQTSLPRGPSWDDVRRLIATTEGDRPADIRDRAILLLLAVYGLRADEVRRLRVEDFDWDLERLTVTCPKSRRTRTFPLCRSVGDAVLRYLKEVRPRSSYRAVFMSIRYPIRPLGNVWRIVAKRLRPLGVSLPHHGPHCLRHACASHLLTRGLSLKEIGDHLGHRRPDSTRIYAKVDLAGLRQVADFDLGGLQ